LAYLPTAPGEPVAHQLLRDMAALLGFSIPDEDLAPLATALRDQLASVTRIEALGLSGAAPVGRFDPRWHD